MRSRYGKQIDKQTYCLVGRLVRISDILVAVLSKQRYNPGV